MKMIKFVCGCFSLLCWLAVVQTVAGFIEGTIPAEYMPVYIIAAVVAAVVGYRLGKFYGED